jgi:hypothetical protein
MAAYTVLCVHTASPDMLGSQPFLRVGVENGLTQKKYNALLLYVV